MKKTNKYLDIQKSKAAPYPLTVRFTFENPFFGLLEVWDKGMQISASYIPIILWDDNPQKVLLNCIKTCISQQYPSYDITLNSYKRR